MMPPTPEKARQRLVNEHNIWVATVRPDGRPHLVPVWFVWHADKLYIGIQPGSVKGRNLAHNPNIALALEDGGKVVICEGLAAPLATPWPAAVAALFKQKYGWDILADSDGYGRLLEITPSKWLTW